MADISDVYAAFCTAILAVLYPSGAPQPGIASPVTGSVCRIYPGWPAGYELDADLLAGTVNVSVFSPQGGFHNTTRFPRSWITTGSAPTTLSAAVSGTTVTFSGTMPSADVQNVAVIVDNVPYVYQTGQYDTLATVAAGLATAISANRTATANGAVLTIPNSHLIVARIGGVQTGILPVQQVTRNFQVHFFCNSPAQRDLASAPVVSALASSIFLSLNDGTGARIILTNDIVLDVAQKPLCYRRILGFSVEFSITQASTFPQAVVLSTSVQGGQGTIGSFTASEPPIVVWES
jgi:hypothetical protein